MTKNAFRLLALAKELERCAPVSPGMHAKVIKYEITRFPEEVFIQVEMRSVASYGLWSVVPGGGTGVRLEWYEGFNRLTLSTVVDFEGMIPIDGVLNLEQFVKELPRTFPQIVSSFAASLNANADAYEGFVSFSVSAGPHASRQALSKIFSCTNTTLLLTRFCCEVEEITSLLFWTLHCKGNKIYRNYKPGVARSLLPTLH